MSRTQTRTGGVTNPVKLNIVYKPNSGEFEVYDKSKKEKTTVDSVRMIILDADRTSLTGFSPTYDTGYISTLVFNSKTEPITLGIISNGQYKLLETGFYKEMKEKYEGIKYTKPVFGLVDFDGSLQIAELQLTGQARSTFGDWFNKNRALAENDVVTFTATEEIFNFNKKTGELDLVPKEKQKKWMTTWLHSLIINTEEISEEDADTATEEDVKLQAYFKTVTTSTAPPAEDTTGSVTGAKPPVSDEDEGDGDGLPF